MAGYFFDDFGFVGGQLASGTRGRELLRLDFLEQLARALHVRLSSAVVRWLQHSRCKKLQRACELRAIANVWKVWRQEVLLRYSQVELQSQRLAAVRGRTRFQLGTIFLQSWREAARRSCLSEWMLRWRCAAARQRSQPGEPSEGARDLMEGGRTPRRHELEQAFSTKRLLQRALGHWAMSIHCGQLRGWSMKVPRLSALRRSAADETAQAEAKVKGLEENTTSVPLEQRSESDGEDRPSEWILPLLRGRRVGEMVHFPEELKKLDTLAASTTAYLTACYALGVRDGHDDNIMLREDGSLFRVDFGFVFGATPEIDTPQTVVARAVTFALGERWLEVVAACGDSLTALTGDSYGSPPAFDCLSSVPELEAYLPLARVLVQRNLITYGFPESCTVLPRCVLCRSVVLLARRQEHAAGGSAVPAGSSRPWSRAK
eukprot:g3150.t1